MYDLHCHFIPGLDDGPRSLAEAVQVARKAAENGITHAVMTPHYGIDEQPYDLSELRIKFDELASELKKERVPLKIAFAAECRLSAALLACLDQGDQPYIGYHLNKPVLLVELPYCEMPDDALELIQALVERGIVPMIAHPERNKTVMADVNVLAPFIESGCLLQVTAGSLTGLFGLIVERCAKQLLEKAWVTVIGSDAYDIRFRPPNLKAAQDITQKLLGQELADELVLKRPRALSEDLFMDAVLQADSAQTEPVQASPAQGGKATKSTASQKVATAEPELETVAADALHVDYLDPSDSEASVEALTQRHLAQNPIDIALLRPPEVPVSGRDAGMQNSWIAKALDQKDPSTDDAVMEDARVEVSGDVLGTSLAAELTESAERAAVKAARAHLSQAFDEHFRRDLMALIDLRIDNLLAQRESFKEPATIDEDTMSGLVDGAREVAQRVAEEVFREKAGAIRQDILASTRVELEALRKRSESAEAFVRSDMKKQTAEVAEQVVNDFFVFSRQLVFKLHCFASIAGILGVGAALVVYFVLS